MCIRHPQRETGRSCTRCGRPACTECLVQAAVGSHCVDCVHAARPPAAERLRRWNARQAGVATRVFVIANVLVYLVTLLRDRATPDGSNDTGFDFGVSRLFIADGQWWRMITAGFIHFGMIHLLMNSVALWTTGPGLENIVGSGPFTLTYLAGVLGGSAGALVLEPQRPGILPITGGASGAVFALFGALAVVLWRRGINPLQTSLGSVLILNIFITFMIPGISIGGHFGGLIAGGLCGLGFAPPSGRRPTAWVPWAVPTVVALAAVAVGLAASA